MLKMDIKKPDIPIRSTPTSVTTQTSSVSDQTNQQLNLPSINSSTATQLKIGQLVELLVLKMTDSKAIMNIVGTDQQVHTSDKDLLHVGQQIKAKITAFDPVIQLQVLSPRIKTANVSQPIVAAALRQSLPLQQSMSGLLENIQQITRNPQADYSATLKNIGQSFSQSLPPLLAFQEAEVLPQILKKSGIFTENLISKFITSPKQQPAFPNNDLKIALLRLADRLRSIQPNSESNTSTRLNTPTAKLDTSLYAPASLQPGKVTTPQPPVQGTSKAEHHTNKNSPAKIVAPLTQEQLVEKLLTQTEGVLSRLQTLQLQHVQSNEQQKPAWAFEIPVRTDSTTEHLEIYIEQDEAENQNKNYILPWKVILKFNIAELGPVQAHVTLQGSKVSVNFWAENKQTSVLFSEYLNQLDKQLSNAGLETGQLKCHCDKAPKLPVQAHAQVIDEKI